MKKHAKPFSLSVVLLLIVLLFGGYAAVSSVGPPVLSLLVDQPG